MDVSSLEMEVSMLKTQGWKGKGRLESGTSLLLKYKQTDNVCVP